MEFWTAAASLALIAAGLTIAGHTNPFIEEIKSSVSDLFVQNPHFQSILKYGFKCLICQGFWISFILMFVMEISIIEFLTGYGIFVVLVLLLPNLD